MRNANKKGARKKTKAHDSTANSPLKTSKGNKSDVQGNANGMDNAGVQIKNMKGETNSMEMARNFKYDAFSRAPFIVHFSIKSTNGAGRSQTTRCEISEKLDKCNVKYNKITKYSRDIWKATFPSKTLANSAITNKMVQDLGITAFVPKYKISRKVVVPDLFDDMSMAEVKEIIEEENSNLLIANLYRLKQRNENTREVEDSEKVCMELRGEVIPEKMWIQKLVIQIRPYIQSIPVCFKCGHIGHVSKFCENPAACLACAGDHQSREEPCSAAKNCVNCGGPHNTLDRGCPVYKKYQEIARVMAYNNLPFLEARSLVERDYDGPMSRFDKTLKNSLIYQSRNGSSAEYRRMTQGSMEENASYKLAVLKKTKGSVRNQLSDIVQIILSDPDVEILCERIKKTIDLHVTNNLRKDKGNGSNK